jgi:tetratricopeptide (TPR) repeat protein
MNVRKTQAWEAAEWEHAAMTADQMMPLLGGQLTLEQKIGKYEQILEKCPQFYPALLEMGFCELQIPEKNSADQHLEAGCRLMLELAGAEHLEDEFNGLIENLEKSWRYDLSKTSLEQILDHQPSIALWYDYIAHAEARMGQLDEALHHSARAVEIEPGNRFFRTNLGWIHLIAGNLEAAGAELTEALRISPDDQVANGNLEIQRYLSRHGGNYLDYLLRPIDREKLERLADDEEWQSMDQLCGHYNELRLEALAQHLFLEDANRRYLLNDLLTTLREFFGFVGRVYQGGYFLNEDIAIVRRHFKAIMHKFIFKFADVDSRMIEEIYASVFEYYGFLLQKGIVSAPEFQQFQNEVLEIKQELLEKMQKYNAVRRDESINENKKEAIRDEIFEGDHAWPFI